MKEFFRYLQGYLRIRVWGYSPERFMNLCGSRGILLWDITRREEDYLMYISLSGFFRLRPVVRKTGTRVSVLERCGLPFLLRRMRRRKVFVMGLPACLAFLIVMSRFIWAIDFEGNRSVTDDMLMDFLTANGVTGRQAKWKTLELGRCTCSRRRGQKSALHDPAAKNGVFRGGAPELIFAYFCSVTKVGPRRVGTLVGISCRKRYLSQWGVGTAWECGKAVSD